MNLIVFIFWHLIYQLVLDLGRNPWWSLVLHQFLMVINPLIKSFILFNQIYLDLLSYSSLLKKLMIDFFLLELSHQPIFLNLWANYSLLDVLTCGWIVIIWLWLFSLDNEAINSLLLLIVLILLIIVLFVVAIVVHVIVRTTDVQLAKRWSHLPLILDILLYLLALRYFPI